MRVEKFKPGDIVYWRYPGAKHRGIVVSKIVTTTTLSLSPTYIVRIFDKLNPHSYTAREGELELVRVQDKVMRELKA